MQPAGIFNGKVLFDNSLKKTASVENADIISDPILAHWEKKEIVPHEVYRKEMARRAKKPHPIKIEKYRAEMHLEIYWHDETHGDGDNIFKGIADSLFENDKEVSGSFVPYHTHDKVGRVVGVIILEKGMLYDERS